MSPQGAGVSGTLFPSGYLVSALATDATKCGAWVPEPRMVRQARAVWEQAGRSCGPASGLRTLFDLLAEPLFKTLDFTVSDLSFGRSHADGVLVTPRGTRLALLLLPWATSASTAWRDVFRATQTNASEWAVVLAPPFLSLVSARGWGARRRLDFSLPVVLGQPDGPFWTLLHARSHDASAGHVRDGTILERLMQRAEVYQSGVRRDLQGGVMDALEELERVIDHRPRQRSTRANHARTPRDQALTLVYRILFLLFAESRELVPVQHPVYGPSYSVAHLAIQAMRGATLGCWQTLGAMTRLARLGCRSRSLTVPPFGGHLFERASAPDIEAPPTRTSRRSRGSERDLAASRALARLAARSGPAGLEAISYRDLGVEQLGAVYERLLDAPLGGSQRERADRHERSPGLRRKTTGTFYTPQPLAEFIVRRTLAPLVRGVPADAILRLRVLDPAMGSGACLIAACRYLATAYEEALIAEGTAVAGDFDDHARANLRRLVAERCLAGVDANPTAVELARLSLWLATLSFGKPLGFLDHRLRTGNSLIGAWPDDLARVPTHRARTPCPLPLLEGADIEDALSRVCRPLSDLLNRHDDTVEAVQAKAATWRALTSQSSPLEPWRRAASLWCARWFWPAGPAPAPAETRALIAAVLTGDRTLPIAHVQARTAAAESAAATHAFFHWPLEFPDVFYGPSGEPLSTPGFDAVIGNPPWEMLRQDAARDGSDARAVQIYVRESGQYPSCDRGHLNLYQAFVDRALALAKSGGRVGLVVPWGLASDDGAGGLRRRLLDTCHLDTLVGLDNARGLFPIHRGMRFVVFTATTGSTTREIRCRFGISTADELDQLPEVDDAAAPAYPVRLTRNAIDTVGGPTLRFPDVRDTRLLDLVDGLLQRFPRLSAPDGWHVTFGRELNVTEAARAFGKHGLAVVDGKHIHPFMMTRTNERRIERAAALAWLPRAPFDNPRLAYRDVSAVGNTQALIAAVIPADVVTTHTLYCLKTSVPTERQHFLCAMFNSYAINACVRLLMGGHVTTSLVESLPIPVWRGDRTDRNIAATAAWLSEGTADVEVSAGLQAAVGHRLGLNADEYRAVLDASPMAASLRSLAWDTFTRPRDVADPF